jgi:hypothetical protein
MPKTTIAPYTKADHLAAIKRGEKRKDAPTAVTRASYDEASASLVLELYNGARVVLPIDRIEELRNHTPAALATVEVSPGRDGLLWRSIDVGISAPGLLTDFFGNAVHAHLGHIGGKRSTTTKARASRRNGRKGGRPRTKAA